MFIRPVRPQDAQALRDIYAYYVEHFPYSFEYEAPKTEEFIKRVEAVVGRYPFFVCEADGEILGFAYAHAYHARIAYQWVCETSVYVKDGCEHKGVGTLLYSRLLPSLKKQGFTKALAVLGCPNEGSEAFHEKMGFKLLAAFPDMGYKFGGWHDVKYYALELNPTRSGMAAPIPYSRLEENEK